ncbi:P-loop NTPase fold protein [Pseudomonas paracarnis]|uniref:P-loop NTPase fold protein n=1 Tax=Pseudomonas paracarnis TaxID=2750625 RepID=UPI00191BABE5|nr:P-loop NTPase fold protein [Pseudomonas paracarnis]
MSTSAENPTPIIIDLNQNDTNARLKVTQLVHSQSYKKLKVQIDRDLENSEKAPSSKKLTRTEHDYPYGSGLVYFIDGTRGAGKSTFLQSAFHALGDDKASHSIHPLAYIDPSRIERSEIILLSILKALKSSITSANVGSNLDGENLIQRFREQFKKLAGGLSLFSSNHDQLQDLDPELFFEWGLERAGHSKDLRANFHALLDLSCNILHADALIIAFDDADTHSQHARSVMECIRKYLDTPRLVVLVTGDIELYSLMVRDHFYDSLGDAKHGQVKERADQRHKMVDHLEDQYLLKLFPMHRRLQLRPLWNLLQHEKAQLQLSHKNWSEQLTPDEMVNSLIRRGLRIKNPRDLELYREFLLKQPLRSILQVFSRCAPVFDLVNSDKWNLALSEALSESLRALALGSLYKFGVDVDAIAAEELPALSSAVFDLAVRDGDFDTAAYLRPQPIDADLKNCFAALSADVTRLCAGKPGTLIDYMLAAPGSVALFGKVLRRKAKDLGTSEDRLIIRKQFEQYMGIGRKEDALNWARHAVSILTVPYGASPTTPVVYSGVIGLNKRKPRVGNTQYTTVDSILKTCKKLPALALSLVDVSGSSSRTYASIYNILGLMARLLSLEPKDGKYDVMSVLPKPYPPLTVSLPQWEADNADEDDGEDISDINEDTNKLAQLADSVEEWLRLTYSLRNQLHPSAVLIGKIWTRLYFSLEKVCDDNRGDIAKRAMGAGGLMELLALCVINAFYVEERDYHLLNSTNGTLKNEDSDRTNPLKSAKFFIKKIKWGHNAYQQYPITYLVATCPLILGLLEPSLEARKFVSTIVSSHPEVTNTDVTNPNDSILFAAEQLLCDQQNWEKLSRTYVLGMKWGSAALKINSTTTARKPAKS